MLTVNAYAATSPTGPLAPTTIERRDLGPHDVLIEIKYAGICHSDIHTARGEWGPVTYPLVTGPHSPRAVWMSEWQMPAYLISMRTSCGPRSRRSMVVGASGRRPPSRVSIIATPAALRGRAEDAVGAVPARSMAKAIMAMVNTDMAE